MTSRNPRPPGAVVHPSAPGASVPARASEGASARALPPLASELPTALAGDPAPVPASPQAGTGLIGAQDGGPGPGPASRRPEAGLISRDPLPGNTAPPPEVPPSNGGGAAQSPPGARMNAALPASGGSSGPEFQRRLQAAKSARKAGQRRQLGKPRAPRDTGAGMIRRNPGGAR